MTRVERVERALAHADALWAGELCSAPPPGEPRRAVVIGDPQTTCEQFLRVLDARELLAEDGWLRRDVQLISIGDHFDFKEPEGWSLVDVGRQGERILGFLAAHDAAQVRLIAGNHDLARVMELMPFSDARFEAARKLAAEIRQIYERGEDISEQAARFQREFAPLPNPKIAMRDLSTFEARQRTLVQRLLEAGRFRLALSVELCGEAGDATQPALVTHAGVAERERSLLGVEPGAGPEAFAEALNAFFDERVGEAVARWRRGQEDALDLTPLHVAGSSGAEGGGLLYHRPSNPERKDKPWPATPHPRRYDPRQAPAGLTQVIGHIDADKALEELDEWDTAEAAQLAPGSLREWVEAEGALPRYRGYRPARHAGRRFVFVDAGMNRLDAADVAVLPVVPLADNIAP